MRRIPLLPPFGKGGSGGFGNYFLEYWRGAVDASAQTLFLESPMGIFENKSGWILMLGFTPSASGPQLEADFLKILKSAK
jgi:hypothetical protein